MDKVVLAYSGGLDTSVILTWLKETYGCEVVAYVADVGQGEDLEAVRRKALETGASECIVEDLRERFVAHFVWPMFRAAAVYEGKYLLGTSIARPCIAEGLVRAARRVGADAIAHGATGKGNDQVRFELAAFALEPDIRVIAPWRQWSLRSRSDCIAYAKAHGIPVEATVEKPYSMDANLLHISYEGGVLEDPWAAPDPGIFRWTRDPAEAPGTPRDVVIGFEGGDAVSVDGERLEPAALLGRLNEIAAEHGVGRVDVVEDRFVGMKSRGVYETPGGTVLFEAHRAIESLTMDREAMRVRDQLVPEYASLVYRGFWFAPEREALQALVDETQRDVCGEVRVRLFKGNAWVTGRRSARSLYDPELATFEEDGVYDQADATGFIRLQALRLRMRALRDRRKA